PSSPDACVVVPKVKTVVTPSPITSRFRRTWTSPAARVVPPPSNSPWNNSRTAGGDSAVVAAHVVPRSPIVDSRVVPRDPDRLVRQALFEMQVRAGGMTGASHEADNVPLR